MPPFLLSGGPIDPQLTPISKLANTVTPIALVNSQIGGDGANFTAGAGANRILLMQSYERETSAAAINPVSSMDHGAASSTIITQVDSFIGSTARNCCQGRIMEAAILAGAQAMNVTWAPIDPPTLERVSACVLENVDQVAPIVDTDTLFAGSGTSALMTVNTVQGGAVVIAISSRRDITAIPGNMTELGNSSDGTLEAHFYLGTGFGNGSEDFSFTFASNSTKAIVAVSLRPAT